MAIVRLELSVDILITISIILEVLESLAVAGVIRLKLDFDLIHADLLVLNRDVDAVVHPQVLGVLVKFSSIDNNRSDQLSLKIDKEAFFVIAGGGVCGCNL